MYSDSGQGSCNYALPWFKKQELNKRLDALKEKTNNDDVLELISIMKELIQKID